MQRIVIHEPTRKMKQAERNMPRTMAHASGED